MHAFSGEECIYDIELLLLFVLLLIIYYFYSDNCLNYFYSDKQAQH